MAACTSVAEAVWRDIKASGSGALSPLHNSPRISLIAPGVDVNYNPILSSSSPFSTVTDEQLSVLHFLFGKNFERATRIVDQGGVKRVSGDPSGRFLFQMKLVKPIDLFQNFRKANTMKQGRFLGLDVGHKYVGLAVSDSDNRIAAPLSVLVRKKTNIDLMVKDFQTLVSELSLVGFVVGYPFNVRGSNSIETVQVKLFMEDLRKTGKLDDLSYTYWDERFTSKCVQVLLKPLMLRPVQSKTILDKFAAVGILQGYLDHIHRTVK